MEPDSLDISQIKALILAVDCEQPPLDTASQRKSPQSQALSTEEAIVSFGEAHEVRISLSESPCCASKLRPGRFASKGKKLAAVQVEAHEHLKHSSGARTMTSESQKSGLTEPLSQWIYAEFTTTPAKRPVHEPEAGTRVQDQAGQGQQHRLQTPADGRINDAEALNLLDPVQEAHSEGDTKGQLIELDLDGLSQVDVQNDPYPESKRFQPPETPLAHGKKRNAAGEIVGHLSTTPRLPINPFANHAGTDVGLMNLSQVFRATQAPSSPFAHVLPSDGFSDKPSPAMFRVQQSSAAQVKSSPAKLPHQVNHDLTSDPHIDYVSHSELEMTGRQLGENQATSSLIFGANLQELSDEELQFESPDVTKHIIKRRDDHNVRKRISKPTETPKLSPGRNGAIDGPVNAITGRFHVSPNTRERTGSVLSFANAISTDGHEDNATEDETEHEEDLEPPQFDLPSELEEENKENVNLESRRVQVPRTAATGKRHIFAPRVYSSPSEHRRTLLPSHNQDLAKLAEGSETDGGESSSQRPVQEFESPNIAIADSQPAAPDSSIPRTTKTGQEHALRTSYLSDSQKRVSKFQQDTLPHTSQIDSSMARRMLAPSSQQTESPMAGDRTASKILTKRASSPSEESSDLVGVHPVDGVQSAIGAPADIRSSPPELFRNSLPSNVANGIGEDNDLSNILGDGPISSPKNMITLTSGLPIKNTGGRRDAEMDSYEGGGSVHASTIFESLVPEKLSSIGPTSHHLPRHVLPRSKTSYTTLLPTSIPTDSDTSKQLLSNESTAFVTAQSWITASPSKSGVGRLRESFEGRSPARSGARKSRLFTEIAAEPSPPDEIGEIDLDIDLMTAEDRAFQSIVDGSSPLRPGRRRKRGGYTGLAQLTPPETSFKSTPLVSSSKEDAHNDLQEVQEYTINDSVFTMSETESQARAMTTSHSKQKPNIEVEGRVAKRLRTASQNTKKRAFDHEAHRHNGRRHFTDSRVSSAVIRVRGKGRYDHVNPNGTEKPHINVTRIAAPNRVFARFNGNAFGYFPATCLGIAGGKDPSFKIRFDDGTIGVVAAPMVKKLELRDGDVVKIDQPGLRANNYIVTTSYEPSALLQATALSIPPAEASNEADDGLKYPETDNNGDRSVMVQIKPKSSSGVAKVQSFPVASVYLTTTMWSLLKDRDYSYHSAQTVSGSGLRTPSELPSTPSTPSSRNRRVKQSSTLNCVNTVPKSNINYSSSLFENFVFSITNIADASTRTRLEHLIHEHGGRLLPQGFDSLFTVPDTSGFTADAQAKDDESATTGFSLQLAASGFGFTALLASTHSRSSKFFQALALGIPCLVPRWIEDCVARQTLLPWQRYLLASGESSFLGPGAVRTRVLPAYDAASVTLPDLLGSRPRFLAGARVMLIMGRGAQSLLRAYPFITYALGAASVLCIDSLDAAHDLLASGDTTAWDWICYHNDVGKGLTEADIECALFDEDVAVPKRRKRDSTAAVVQSGGKREKGRIVSTEFIVQSLILGALLSED